MILTIWFASFFRESEKWKHTIWKVKDFKWMMSLLRLAVTSLIEFAQAFCVLFQNLWIFQNLLNAYVCYEVNNKLFIKYWNSTEI